MSLLSSSFFFLMLYSSLSIVVWLPSDHRHCYLFPALPTISLVVSPAAGHSAAPLHCSLISAIPAIFLTSIFDHRAVLPLRPFRHCHSWPPQFWPLFGPSGRCFSWPLQPLISIIAWLPPRSMSLFVRLPLLISIASVHSGLSSATPIIVATPRPLRFFSLRHLYWLRSHIPSPSSFVSISCTTLSHTFVLPHLIP